MLPILHMDETEYGGFLFINSPDGVSLDEYRERVEDEICEMYEADGYAPDDPDVSPAVSPAALFRVATAIRERRVAAMSPAERAMELERSVAALSVSHSANSADF